MPKRTFARQTWKPCLWQKYDTQSKRTTGLPTPPGAGNIPDRRLPMSMIVRDSRTGEVKMVSFSTIQNNGRTLLFPQMIDVTDAKNADEIITIMMKFENDFWSAKEDKEENKMSKAAKRAWAKLWNF